MEVIFENGTLDIPPKVCMNFFDLDYEQIPKRDFLQMEMR